MYIVEIILVAFVLALDAFSAAICQGLKLSHIKPKDALTVAIIFGGVTALMPALGYLVVFAFGQNEVIAEFYTKYSGLIAFVLLFGIGFKNLIDTLRKKEDYPQSLSKEKQNKLIIPEICLVAVAVSIDALMTGFAYAIVQANIVLVVSIIGFVTFALSLLGVYFGSLFGRRWEKYQNIIASIVLMLLGVKFLLHFLNIL